MLDQKVVGHDQKVRKEKLPLVKQLAEKIDDFLILCIYEQDDRVKSDKSLKLNQIHSLSDLPIFTDTYGANSFIIWERVYRESAQIFNSLRLMARNRLIGHIAENIVAYLFMKYKNFSTEFTSIFQDQEKKKQCIQSIEEIIKSDTFLVDEDVWNDFCKWFRIHLTEWVLEEMIESMGNARLAAMDKKELNELFYQYISSNLTDNKQFIVKFASIVNKYTLDWLDKIITSLDLNDGSIQQIESIFGIAGDPVTSTNNFNFPLALNNYIFVMNNAPYQAVREALYQNNFYQMEGKPWPAAPLVKGNVEGVLELRPLLVDTCSQTASMMKETWEEVKALSDLEADIFDALCSIFLFKAKHADDVVEIKLDDLLAIRGLKAKLSGDGRRGGYEEKQRSQIVQALKIIQKLWIDLDKTVVYEKGKPLETKLQGRAFLFVDQNGKDLLLTKDEAPQKISYKVDQVFARYLFKTGRQVALLPLKVLQYDPYRRTWEKRLIRYFSWRWRIQARKGDFLQPNKVSTLLEAAGVQINKRIPSRTRERLETALDTLQQDGLIAAWQYEKWDESIADQKGWGRIWVNALIIIQPPALIKEQYQSIKRSTPGQKRIHSPKEPMEKMDERLGIQIRGIRERFQLSLNQVAEEVEISPAYLSHIERGIKVPSKKIQFKLMTWLERF
ncbi:helix-turn-helix domain-containing protein [Neobacillus mesonae]|uniref:helix-turn-helix domain-containing protein n=1 Tax=Neobacillus mesonae TaxID=1193713 RepID=UPI00257322EA|nr:helix-turn-helix transcriptional regulator [Neobacillus mesonae]